MTSINITSLTCRGPRLGPTAPGDSPRSRPWARCPPGSSTAQDRNSGWSGLLKKMAPIWWFTQYLCNCRFDNLPTSELNPSFLYFCIKGKRFAICSGVNVGIVKFWHSSLTVSLPSLRSLSNQSSSLSLKKSSLALSALLFLKINSIVNCNINCLSLTVFPGVWGSWGCWHQSTWAASPQVPGNRRQARSGYCGSPE